MVILKDLLYILHDVTALEVWAYSDFHLQHQWIFGEDIKETIRQYRDRERGVLSIIDERINVHNEPKKNGTGEIGWGTKYDAIPKEILEAEVTHILLSGRYGEGRELYVHIYLDEMSVQMAMSELAGKERPLNEEVEKERTE